MLEKVETEQLDAMAEAAEAYVQRAFGKRLDPTPIAPTSCPLRALLLQALERYDQRTQS